MKLSKVLHPEIVLDKRGDEHLRRAYQKITAGLGHEVGRGYYSTLTSWEFLDPNIREHFLIAWKFRRERPPVYYVPKDFVEAISRVDRDIPVDLLPKTWFGYISFAEGSMFDESDEIQGAYVYIGPPEQTAINPNQYGPDKICLWVSYVCKDLPRVQKLRAEHGIQFWEEGDRKGMLLFPSVGRLLVELKSERFASIVKNIAVTDYTKGKVIQASSKDHEARDLVYRTLVNLVLYINSVDADLVKAPTTEHLSNRQKSERSNQGKPVNECAVPITLVSWNYRKPVQFQKDSTWVETHMRFQRCGPGFTQVKLIWVAPHERHFQKSAELAKAEQS